MSSKGFLSNKAKKTDSCIGNERVRTIVIGTLVIIWGAMTFGFNIDQYNFWEKHKTFIGFTIKTAETFATAYTLISIGTGVIVVSSIAAIITFLSNCGNTLGRIAGVGMFIGGSVYIVGIIIVGSQYKDTNKYSQWNAAIDFAMGLLPAVTAFFIGLDAFIELMNKETTRLFWNLLLMMLVCGIAGFSFYGIYGEQKKYHIELEEYLTIASGYAVIFVACCLYVVLYLLTCCTCDCKDKALVRILIAVTLLIGAGITCIGYWTIIKKMVDREKYNPGPVTSKYIGYTVFLGGMCTTWAIDMGIDDFK